jgi:hypothetical protein
VGDKSKSADTVVIRLGVETRDRLALTKKQYALEQRLRPVSYDRFVRFLLEFYQQQHSHVSEAIALMNADERVALEAHAELQASR